jgi:thiol-disulfide isomerase/thioredoxin
MKSLIVVALVLSFSACSSKTEQPQSNTLQSASQYKQNVSLLVSSEKASGQQAPDFSWYDSKGNKVSFAEFSKGKPVLVNFWATWCGPCVKEIPDLVAINEEYAAKGALIIGISADRDDDALNLVSEFTNEHHVAYPIVIDNGDLEEAFGGLRGYPTTFYIDRTGKIVKKFIGLQSKEKFSKEFDTIL